MTALLLGIPHVAEAITMPSGVSKAREATATQLVAERPDRVSAALTARLQNNRVLVADETTESTSTYVNPDGTLTLEASSGPSRIKQGDKWTPIDTTLVSIGGVLKPRAAFGGLEISGGGDQKPLVKLVPGENLDFALFAPAKLPTPVVQGDKAVFPDAAGPGADIVVTSLPTGVQHDVVLRQRPTGPVEYRFPMKSTGLSLSETEEGALQITAGKGKVLAAAPRPFMFDAEPASALTKTSTSRRAAKIGDIDVRVAGEEGRQEMVLRPDPDFLQDPTTTYPVTVDPAITLPLGAGRTILSRCPDGNLFMEFTIKVGMNNWECPANPSRKIFSRSLLAFDTSSLAGQDVMNARLEMVADLWNCPTGQQLKVQRIIDPWSTAAVFWNNQPAVTADGAVTSSPPAICTPASAPAADVPWSIPVTDIAKAWATGAQGHGLMLQAAIEDRSRPTFTWDFHQPGQPKLVVTVGATPWVEHLRTVPVASPTRDLESAAGQEPKIAGRLFTTTTRPTLHSGVRGTGARLRADFEIEHDPAFSGQGSGLIWSGSADDVPAGEVAKLTVPEGTLQDGWRIRWRSRAVDGDLESAWSQWQPIGIDATRPAEPRVWCAGASAEGTWVRRTEMNCTFESPSRDVTEYLWEFDNPVPTKIQEAGYWEDFLGETKTIKQDLTDGWHTLYVRTRDKAHNLSDVVAYSVGIGPGGLVTAQKQTQTHRTVTLDAAAPSSRNAVTYIYSTSTLPWAVWSDVPTQDVFAPGSDTPIDSWPQVRTDTSKNFSALVWDLAKTLKESQEPEGLIYLRACFMGGTEAAECSEPLGVSLSRSAISDSHAISDIGPGSVAHLNGDFALKSTDASAFGVQMTRTHRSLNPAFESSVPYESRVFGPGWQAGFPSAPSWVSSYVPSDGSQKGWIQLIGPDGSTYTYTKKGTVYSGIGDAADGTSISVTNEELTVTDRAGARTTYVKIHGSWVVARTEGPAAESAVTYFRDSKARITRILTPTAAGVQCGATLTPGCRALELSYATATTATGVSSGWGDFRDQVKSVSLTAFDPQTGAMKTVGLATYSYDSTGHLRQVTDPRTNLATVYYYTGEGRISQMTPPGLAPWRMEYDDAGRLAHVQREGGEIDPTWAVAYDVPIGGSGAPVDLTVARTAKWGQVVDLPVTGRSLFPASHVPPRGAGGVYSPTAADWEYASIVYSDVNGRAVNTAKYGAGAWQISATRYDEKSNVVWDLTPGNLAQALDPTVDTDVYVAQRGDSAERANLLASTSTYSETKDLLSAEGPVRPVRLEGGDVVSARQRTTYTYDEGKPLSSMDYHLVTTTRIEPMVVDGTVDPAGSDKQVITMAYDPIQSGDASGWTLRKATSTTTPMQGQDAIVNRVRYDEAGREIERRAPASDGGDAGATMFRYFTAGEHPTTGLCGNKPEWSGWPCQVGPAGQPAGNPLPVRQTTYTYYGDTAIRTEVAGQVTRTLTFTHDAAGRVTKSLAQVTPADEGGTAVPETTYGFDPATGLPTETSSAGGDTVSLRYDSFGRAVSTTDATGNVSAVTFNVDGQIATTHDGKGLITFTYDGVDAAGKTEHRGLMTRVDSGGGGTFTGAYDPDGRLTRQVYPGGLTGTARYDNTGTQVALAYTKNNASWLSFAATPDNHGRVASRRGPGDSGQNYDYDEAGRLVQVTDSYAGTCTTRVYGFDANTNRTSLSAYPGGDSGQCTTSTTPSVQRYDYDQADRVINTGYSYDSLGRTSNIPATDVTGTGAVSIGYFTNDLVASLTQDTQSTRFTRDPLGRVKSMTTAGGSRPGTVVHHYSGAEDSPAWTTELDGSWTRNIVGLAGMAAIQRQDGSISLQLANMHGDIVATADTDDTTGVASYSEHTEYGVPRTSSAADDNRYGWLGSSQRAADSIGGLIHMGVRLYNPATGRFLQVDPKMGGSANAYDYCSGDPINKLDLAGTDEFLGGHGEWSDITHKRGSGEEGVIEAGYGVTCAVVKPSGACIIVDFDLEVHDYYRTHTQKNSYSESRKVTIWVCDGKAISANASCGGPLGRPAPKQITETRKRIETIVTSYHKKVSIHTWRAGGKVLMRRVIDTGWLQTGRKVSNSYTEWVRPHGPY
ncbi:DNRLRE domain-containing protein [Microtetraspora sp. NBRC 13810]|uniref:DNRLRE domain-containing protein n=1 Tax=Microtetraspora sp. NBRC 13810 TaxID=3030990 RepID=UPI0025537EA5|nr:DNRLRE domain-containing protein [Microtetraspora sp. NBRC 13810]